MKPTKEQLDRIVTELDSILGGVYMRCDGYLIYAHRVRVAKNRLGIQVWVNGTMNGSWISHKTTDEEPLRFYRPKTTTLYRPTELKKFEKAMGKRYCKEKGLYAKITLRSPIWNDGAAFIRHVTKHNESIEILDYATYKSAIDALKAKETAHAA